MERKAVKNPSDEYFFIMHYLIQQIGFCFLTETTIQNRKQVGILKYNN